MIGHLFRRGGWIALILLAVAAGFGWFGFKQQATARALDDHGVVTTATVEAMRTDTRRVRTSNGTRTETDRFVTYAYETLSVPGGQPVPQRVEHQVPKGLYEELSRGEEVEIRYLPEDPTRADFFPGETRRDARLLGWFGLGFLAAAAIFGGIALKSARRAHRLDRAGVKVEGIVEGVRRSKTHSAFTVRYTDAGGVERQATTHPVQGPFWEATDRGATVSLRYDPQDPSNVALA